MKRIVVGMSGSSGVIYGIRILEILRENPEVQTHLILSHAAKMNIESSFMAFGLALARLEGCIACQKQGLARRTIEGRDGSGA